MEDTHTTAARLTGDTAQHRILERLRRLWVQLEPEQGERVPPQQSGGGAQGSSSFPYKVPGPVGRRHHLGKGVGGVGQLD